MMTCKKDVEPYVFNAEIKVSDIRAKQVLVEAINDEEGFEKLSAIVYYSIDEKLDELKQYEMTYEDDRFKAYLTELQDGTRYYYKVVFHGKYNSVETEIDTFETEKIVLPAVTTMQVSDVTTTSAKCGGEVTSEGNGTVTARGICWSISQNPTIEDNKTNDGSGTGSFASQIPDLVPNTQYYVRAYATNEAGTAYGEIVVFYTSKEEQPEIVLPTVTTNSVTNITANSAQCGGNVISDGNGTVTARGICWSISQNPTIEDNKTNDGSGTGSFASQIPDLVPNTQYYVRAYATNEVGTAYGDEISFTTLLEKLLPTVTTSDVTDITSNSATCGGNVISDGNGTVTARGICWSISQNPTIEDNKTNDGSGTGSFASQIPDLVPNTQYYVRAYATNEVGTAYGDEISFTTLLEKLLPTVTTSDVTDITSNSATCGGNVISDGNGTVTARGICWSISQNPTIEDNKTNDGSGTGSFASQIPDLVPNTQYYVRAYATNEVGTSYGEVKSFVTLSGDGDGDWGTNQTFNVNGVSFTMIAVEGGTFKMGAQSSDLSGDNYDSDAFSYESPVHSVTLSSYYIGETEVTQELWEAVMGSNPSYYSGYPQRPVESVSWNDCQEFITKLNNLTGRNFRLPTEAEWEYAARGGNKSKGYKYSGSNTIGDVAWYDDNSGSKTHDVKAKAANELGIYDMSGNVWEWCQDLYGDYSSGSQTNPTGPSSGSYRVLRGGSWHLSARNCRVSHRDSYYPGDGSSNFGLRLAL